MEQSRGEQALDFLAACAAAGARVESWDGSEAAGNEFEEVDNEDEAGEYKGSPAKVVPAPVKAGKGKKTEASEDEADDDDDEEGDEEATSGLRASGRRLRSEMEAPFLLPEVGARIAIEYPAGEYHGTVCTPVGWKAGQVYVAFDDGDHQSFTNADLKRCHDTGSLKMVTEEHPLHGQGCVEGKPSMIAAGVQVSKARGSNLKVEGVWLGLQGIVGKEGVDAYEGFVAANRSHAEYKTLLMGCIVRSGDQSNSMLGIVVRTAKCPMDASADPKQRFFQWLPQWQRRATDCCQLTQLISSPAQHRGRWCTSAKPIVCLPPQKKPWHKISLTLQTN